jgi:putative SOS response-associated peptidase YedK
MCGRFRLTRASKLAERFGIEAEDDWVPRYNIAPTQNVEVIRHHQEEPKRFGSQMRWGLIPFWAKDASSGIINARAETIASKFSFRDALKKRRCLIPADGFYEWVRPVSRSDDCPAWLHDRTCRPIGSTLGGQAVSVTSR